LADPTPRGAPLTTTSTPPALSALSGTYALDTTHSRIGFMARHAMVTKVRGAFNEFEGTATLDFDDVSRSSASVTIEVSAVKTA
jgi:polyisoprenoid-binding protein YceI